MNNLYFKAIICLYFSNMCMKQVSFSKSGAKSYLISEYAIKTNTRTKQLLQRYAGGTNNNKNGNVQYRNMFPTHRRQAIDHFEV